MADESKTVTPGEEYQAQREARERTNALLDKLGNILLKLNANLADIKKANADNQTLSNAHLTQLGIAAAGLARIEAAMTGATGLPVILAAVRQVSADVQREVTEARKDIARTDQSLDGLRDDLTPPHGTSLAEMEKVDREVSDRDAKVKLGPVTAREKFLVGLAKSLPAVVVGIGLCMLFVLWLLFRQGDGIGIVPLKPHAPALPVPQLEKPREP